jgi:hypothetical protein
MILWAKLKSIARKQTVGANLRAAAIKYDGKAVADRTDEPFANDRAEDNLNVVGRLYYSASTTLCCAHSLSEDGAAALGTPASVSNKSIRKPHVCRISLSPLTSNIEGILEVVTAG